MSSKVFALILLASVATIICYMKIERMNEKARKPLREIEIEITGIQGSLAQNASTCAYIRGYGASAKLPGPPCARFFCLLIRQCYPWKKAELDLV